MVKQILGLLIPSILLTGAMSSCRQSSKTERINPATLSDEQVLPGLSRAPLPSGWSKNNFGHLLVSFDDTKSTSTNAVEIDFGFQAPGSNLTQIFIIQNNSAQSIGTGNNSNQGSTGTVHLCACEGSQIIPLGYIQPSECLKVVVRMDSSSAGVKSANIIVGGILNYSARATVREPTFQTFDIAPQNFNPQDLILGDCKDI